MLNFEFYWLDVWYFSRWYTLLDNRLETQHILTPERVGKPGKDPQNIPSPNLLLNLFITFSVHRFDPDLNFCLSEVFLLFKFFI